MELDLPLPQREDEVSTDLRDLIQGMAEAEARGGREGVMEFVEKRGALERDDTRFRREGIQLRVSIATLAIALLTLIAAIIGILVTLEVQ